MKRYINYKHHNKKLNTSTFEIINNLLIDTQSIKDAKLFEKQEKRLKDNERIAYINKKTLPNISVYGIPLKELLSEPLAKNRCHQTAIALSLIFPKSKLVYANLTKLGAYHFIKDIEKENEDSLALTVQQSHILNEYEPSFNHSYLVVDGKSLQDSGLQVFNQYFSKQITINPQAQYVIDAQNGYILEKSLYEVLMHPQIMYEYDNLEKSKLWQTLKKQSSLDKNYSTRNLSEIMEFPISPQRNVDDYIAGALKNDMRILALRPNPQQKLFNDYQFIRMFGGFMR